MTPLVDGRRGRRIVVVDNDPGALDLVTTDLRLEGHEIIGTATDGDAGLALVAELQPDVLVIDHRMPPGPWGMDVAERIVRLHPGTTIVLYTNYQSAELVSRSERAGVHFVPKGNLRTLRRAVAG